ncbi:MAG: hypothetical protein QM504_10135 [Pseudomonadota bacterium]
MPKSKNSRKGSKSKMPRKFGQPKVYRKPVAKYQKTKSVEKPVEPIVINYIELLKKLLVKDEYSLHKVAQIQKLALSQALLGFNKEPLIVPCEANFEYFGPKRKPELVYHTRYQDVKKAIMDKLRMFDLFFGFISIDSAVDEKSGFKQIQVTMDLRHGLGGKLTVTSKPVLVVSCNINNNQLTIDKCVSSATTKAKKDVLTGSLLNVLVDMPECYSGKLVEYTDDKWNPITPFEVKKLNNEYARIPDKMLFLKYLKENYNVRGLRDVRGFQFDDVLFHLQNWEQVARAS